MVRDAVSVSDIKYVDDSSVVDNPVGEPQESGVIGTLSDEGKSSMPSLADEKEETEDPIKLSKYLDADSEL